MRYLDTKFSVRMGESQAYRDEWERIFTSDANGKPADDAAGGTPRVDEGGGEVGGGLAMTPGGGEGYPEPLAVETIRYVVNVHHYGLELLAPPSSDPATADDWDYCGCTICDPAVWSDDEGSNP